MRPRNMPVVILTCDNSDPAVQIDLLSPRLRLWHGKRSVECCDCNRQESAHLRLSSPSLRGPIQ